MGRMEDQHAVIENSSLDIEKLKAEEIYGLSECAWFFKKTDSFWELSNMAGAMPVIFESQRCNSSEQLYQASKYGPDVECVPASNPDAEPNVRKRILAQRAAKGSKMTQKCAHNARLFREDWEDDRFEVRIHSMLWVLELKLWCNLRTFGTVLKSTGDLPIVEKSRRDTFWGSRDNDGVLVGKNVLGKLLTLLRDETYESVRNR
jgi:N-glycosidase YbiA